MLNYKQIGLIFVNFVFPRWKKLGFCASSDKGGNLGYLIKVKRTPPRKNLAPDESRQEQLKGAFDLQFQNAIFRCVLLFDDIYRSGETLKAATHVLRDKGGVSRVLVLTLTQTRTKQ